MAGQGRPHRWSLWLAPASLGLLVGAALRSTRADDWHPYLRPMQEDAEITDVCFVDRLRGWAVGDRGVIWQTIDGGQSWKLKESGVNCRLESIHFSDPQHGWIAGGEHLPYTHMSKGVLLVTHNGGQTWELDQALMLPALKQVVFFGTTQGWALGDSSALFPTGVFSTDNGGRSWAPVSGGGLQGWLAGDFSDPFSGVIAGRHGSLAVVRRRGLEATRTPDLGLRGLQCIKLTSPTHGWLVGDGGLILTTADAGRSWQMPTGDTSKIVGNQFDWRAVAAYGRRTWIAGTPGSRVLMTDDGGQTWQAFATNQTLPINDLHFVDETNGWAVGSMGAILVTRDGGRTWARQHSGATRAAILALLSGPEAVPFEMLAHLSGNEGYLSVVECLNRTDLEAAQPQSQTLNERMHDAVVAVGGSDADTAWQFPLRQAGLALSAEQLLETWNRVHDGHAVERLESHLVRQIRMWRPDIVVTHSASPRGDDPLGHVLNQMVLRAVEQAADPTRYPEQSAQMGLEAWKVKKLLSRLPDGQPGSMNVTTSQMATRLGRSLSDMADLPRGLVRNDFAPSAGTVGFQLLVDAIPQGVGGHDFFSGITLYPGGEARRLLGSEAAGGMDLMHRTAQRHRNIKAILSATAAKPQDAAKFLAQLGDLTRDLDPATAGDVLFQLAAHYRTAGQWSLAAETLDHLVAHYPNHPLTAPALVTLLQSFASSEVAWHASHTRAAEKPKTAPTPGMTIPTTLGQVFPASGTSPITTPITTSAAPLQTPQLNRKDSPRYEQAAAVAHMIEQRFPSLFAEPRVQFPLSVADRHRGFPRTAERSFLNMVRSRPQDAWWACATGEQWLVNPQQGAPSKTICRAAALPQKPKLDGKLDDAVWQRSKPLELRSALGDDAEWPAVAVVAHDHEFLYLAVHCRRAPKVEYPTSQQPRPRDPDFARQDRVEFYLDLDRDWSTYYRLVVDYRGWAADDCWGDKTWNPEWFVAAGSEGDTWTVEAAIPLKELTGEAPTARDVWALGVQRVVPGVGFQSWTTPASTSVVPEGFGYLMFD